VNLTIRPKKKISSMLVAIPIIQEKVIRNLSLLHLLFCTVNTVMHSYDTSAVLPDILFDKGRQKTGVRFQVSTIFFRFFVSKFRVQTSVWTKSFKQVHRQYLILEHY